MALTVNALKAKRMTILLMAAYKVEHVRHVYDSLHEYALQMYLHILYGLTNICPINKFLIDY